jgi:hypothetical protein
VSAAVPPPSPAPDDPAATAAAAAEKERAKIADLVRDNPGLATVMEVFRGTIVRTGTEAAAPAGQETVAEIRPPDLESTVYDPDLDESEAPME